MSKLGEWELVARFGACDGAVLAFDPHCYSPGQDEGARTRLLLPGPAGEACVFLQRVRFGSGERRNAAVRVMLSEAPETSRDRWGEIIIDSELLAIAPAATLPLRWQVGGALNESSISISVMNRMQTAVEARRAAELLQADGFTLSHERDWLYCFTRPLSNADIERAGRLLQQSGVPGSVHAVRQHSEALIWRQVDEFSVALLDDRCAPYLAAFEAGWGDGTYEWYALYNGDAVIGFESRTDRGLTPLSGRKTTSAEVTFSLCARSVR